MNIAPNRRKLPPLRRVVAYIPEEEGDWVPSSKRLLAQAKAVPFAFDVQVCCCHGFTWQRMEADGRLNIVRWSD
jgi:hypothetical protein